MDVQIVRFGSLPDIGTFGKLLIAHYEFFTVERPWIPNPTGEPGGMPRKSCMPAGEYELVPFSSASHPDCWAFVNEALGIAYRDKRPTVPRYTCLLHSANWPKQVIGCVGPGRTLVHLRGSLGVTNSKNTMRDIRRIMDPHHTHRAIITWENIDN